jgi:outer membrane lipoprotein-sorting protein
MKNSLATVGFFSFFWFTTVVAMSNGVKAALGGLSAKDRDVFNRVNAYFKNIETIRSNFVQTSEFDHNIADGVFYIARPNKFRFEYFSPRQILIVSNGKIINHYDVDLDEVSIVTNSVIPMVFLLERHRGLESMNLRRFKVTFVGNECIIMTEVSDNSDVRGIEYIFDKAIEKLHGINIYMEENQKISLSLMDTNINLKLSDNLFMFKNPHFFNRRK